MILYYLFLAVALPLLGYRIYQTTKYYKEANNNDISEEERKMAYRNYIVHILFCVVFIVIIGWSVYTFLQ
jgi:hypothetical protein